MEELLQRQGPDNELRLQLQRLLDEQQQCTVINNMSDTITSNKFNNKWKRVTHLVCLYWLLCVLRVLVVFLYCSI